MFIVASTFPWYLVKIFLLHILISIRGRKFGNFQSLYLWLYWWQKCRINNTSSLAIKFSSEEAFWAPAYLWSLNDFLKVWIVCLCSSRNNLWYIINHFKKCHSIQIVGLSGKWWGKYYIVHLQSHVHGAYANCWITF